MLYLDLFPFSRRCRHGVLTKQGKLPLKKGKAFKGMANAPHSLGRPSTSTMTQASGVSLAEAFSSHYQSDARSSAQGGGDVEPPRYRPTRQAHV